MSDNVIALPIKSRLEIKHNTTQAELHAMIRPIFLWMHDHGISSVVIEREDAKALVTIDGVKP